MNHIKHISSHYTTRIMPFDYYEHHQDFYFEAIVISLNFQVIQIYKHPLIISMIAARTANTGQLINLENDLNMIVNDLAQAVVEN